MLKRQIEKTIIFLIATLSAFILYVAYAFGDIIENEEWLIAYFYFYCINFCLLTHYILTVKENYTQENISNRYMDDGERFLQEVTLFGFILCYYYYFRLGFYEYYFWDTVTYSIDFDRKYYEITQEFFLIVACVTIPQTIKFFNFRKNIQFHQALFVMLICPILFFTGHFIFWVLFSYENIDFTMDVIEKISVFVEEKLPEDIHKTLPEELFGTKTEIFFKGAVLSKLILHLLYFYTDYFTENRRFSCQKFEWAVFDMLLIHYLTMFL